MIQSINNTGGIDWRKYLLQVASAPLDNSTLAAGTSQDLLTITGKGIILSAKVNVQDSSYQISLIIDDVEKIMGSVSGTTFYGILEAGAHSFTTTGYATILDVTGPIYFDQSLIVRIKNINTVDKTAVRACRVDYAIK